MVAAGDPLRQPAGRRTWESRVEIFGELERLIDDLYPYRWAIAAAVVAQLALLGVTGYARGWHRAIWRRRLLSAAIALPVLLITLPLGYYALSPLWSRTTLHEESPLAAIAVAQPAPDMRSATATPTPTSPRATATIPRSTMLTQAATPESMQVATAVPTGTAMPSQTPVATPTPELPTPTPFAPHVARGGQFSGADDFHFGRGTALLIETAPGAFTLRFEEFSVRNGPDLHVYLSTAADGLGDGSLDLGSLKATDGSFNYEVPAGVDISAYRSVVIWCEPFAVLFAFAPLG
jgi:hypothetical protein